MKICKRGLDCIQVYNGYGDVRICGWLCDGGDIGNLIDHSFYEVYHSERATSIRNRMYRNDYSMCSHGGSCPHIANNALDKISVKIDKDPEYPEELWLAYEGKCNYHCTVCSAHKNMDDQRVGDWEKNYDEIEKKLKPIMPYVKKISANGRAELFCGERTLKLLSEWKPIAPADECYVTLETNGSLFDEKHWKQIENLGQYNLHVAITIMSFDEEVYQYLSGTTLSIDRIKSNLRFVKSLREKGIINSLELATVVQERNFRELPDFVAKCIGEYGADRVRLRPFFPVGTIDKNIEWFTDVRNPYHPYHKEYLKVMQHPIMSNPKVYKWSGEVKSPIGQHPGIKASKVLKAVDFVLNTNDIWQRIDQFVEKVKGNKVSLYGAGRAGKALVKMHSSENMPVEEWYDKNHHNYLFDGIKIKHPSGAKCKSESNAILITVAGEISSIRKYLINNGWKGAIFSLDDLR